MADDREMLDAHQAAEYLGLNAQTVRLLARENGIPAFKVGGSWRFKRSFLDRWAESQQQTRRGPMHILVVDDDEPVCDWVREVLESEEFSVSAASGGAEALELMRAEVPDLVMLDLKMPEMDGPATLRKIRQHYGSLPVVILTGYPDSELMTRALEYSPITLLAKPATAEQILKTVSAILREEATSGR